MKKPKPTTLLTLDKRLMEVRKLAQSTLQMVEWFNEHWYAVEPENIPMEELEQLKLGKDEKLYLASVTTKLSAVPKPHLATWRGQVGNWEADRIMREAGDKGSHIHHACDVMLNGGVVVYHNPKTAQINEQDLVKQYGKVPFAIIREQQEMLEVWRMQQMIHSLPNIKIISTEFNVFHITEKFAGTVDGILYSPTGFRGCGEGFYIFDIKTGKSAETVCEQMGAYAAAMKKQLDISIAGGLCFRTNVKTENGYKIEQYSKQDLLDGYERFRKVAAVWDSYPNEKPKVFKLPNVITL